MPSYPTATIQAPVPAHEVEVELISILRDERLKEAHAALDSLEENNEKKARIVKLR